VEGTDPHDTAKCAQQPGQAAATAGMVGTGPRVTRKQGQDRQANPTAQDPLAMYQLMKQMSSWRSGWWWRQRGQLVNGSSWRVQGHPKRCLATRSCMQEKRVSPPMVDT